MKCHNPIKLYYTFQNNRFREIVPHQVGIKFLKKKKKKEKKEKKEEEGFWMSSIPPSVLNQS
jgi:hypothetical protein